MNKETQPLLAFTLERIPDETVRRFVFGTGDIETEDITDGIIGNIYKCMLYAFMHIFIKWKNNPEAFNDESPNVRRVNQAFSYVYNGENIGLDLVFYILIEAQLDLGSNVRSPFKGYLNAAENLPISQYRNLIKTWQMSLKHAETDADLLETYYRGIVETLPLLGASAIRTEGDEITMIDIGGAPLKTYKLLTVIDDDFYYLSSYEMAENGKRIRLTYTSASGRDKSVSEVNMQDFLRESRAEVMVSAPEALFARSLYSVNYKYIKNLALAVSDVINETTKRRIYDHYAAKYDDVFQVGLVEPEKLNWDNIITILLIEESPSDLLGFVLDLDGFYFERILKNLELRYNKKITYKAIKQRFEACQAEEARVIKAYIGENPQIIGKWLDNSRQNLMVQCIIEALSKFADTEKSINTTFVESISMRIRNLEKLTSSDVAPSAKVVQLNKMLEKTFRFLIPFYRGVVAYGKERLDYANSKPETLSFAERADCRKRAEGAFFKEAKASIDQIRRASFGKLVETFRELCNRFVFKKGEKIVINPDGIILKSVIGREYLCDVNVFDDLLGLGDDNVFSKRSGVPQDLVCFINNIKHYKASAGELNNYLVGQFMLKAKKLLYFFMYNEDFEREMFMNAQISYDPVYPFVARYSYRSENRDGYNINNFDLYLQDNENGRTVKLLSEDEYRINEMYYCVPNTESSNSRWWIEPFLINCRKYDELFLDIDRGGEEE